MKKALVQAKVVSGNTLGQVSNPNDLMKAQQFIHDRLSNAVNDFVNRSQRPEVAGFDQTLGAGTAFNMLISLPGRVWTPNGKSYDLGGNDTARTVTFEAAHATLPRIDIVVARIEDEVDSELNLIPFIRLRTPEEFEDEVGPYPPQNIEAATELQWKATVAIVKGTAAASPEKPVLAVNEIPLYEVAIPPGLVNLDSATITDVRGIINTIRMLTDQYAQNQITLSDLNRRLGALEDIGGQSIDLSQIFGEIRTLEEILADLLTRASSSADIPEIRYTPSGGATLYNPWEIESSMIQAASSFSGGNSYIDFNLGLRVNFGDAEVGLTPESFSDHPELNARYHTPTGNEAAHETRSEPLTLNDVSNIVSDGLVQLGALGTQLTPNRLRPAVAARSSRYIEIFGGTSATGASGLSDWHTFDAENNTITQRTITGATLPASRTPAMFPYGDGTNVLVIAADNQNPGLTQCFRVNCVTGVATAIGASIPGGDFYGDLIAPGKIFVFAMDYGVGRPGAKTYEFSTSTHSFAELTTTGSYPGHTAGGSLLNGVGSFTGGCFYRENQFLMFWPAGLKTKDHRTAIFDRTTLQWTEVTVANSPLDYADIPSQNLWHSQIVNIGGRPTLIGGPGSEYENTKSRMWEFTESSPVPSLSSSVQYKNIMTWREVAPVNIPAKTFHGAASLLGTTNMPDGKAYVFGGYSKNQNDTNIYGSTRTGLLAAEYNGQTGITIAEGSTFVRFEIDPFVTSFALSSYFVSFAGRYTTQNLKLEASFDNGVTWQQFTPDRAEAKTASSGVTRRMRVTLYRSAAAPPILTNVTESFDSDGAPELEQRTVIRIDPPEDDLFYAFYITPLGKIKFENTEDDPLRPSTPLECLLMLIVAVDGGAATITPLINRRRPIHRVTGTKGAPGVQVVSTLAVPVRYFEAQGVKAADKHLYRIPEAPVVTSSFRMALNIGAEVATGDQYEVVFYG